MVQIRIPLLFMIDQHGIGETLSQCFNACCESSSRNCFCVYGILTGAVRTPACLGQAAVAEFNLASTPKERRAGERGDLPLDAREVLELLDYVRAAGRGSH